jgi:hypothetical protein
MTLSDGSTILVCKLCGLNARYETFVWVKTKETICQNAVTCNQRQELIKSSTTKVAPKRKWWQFV